MASIKLFYDNLWNEETLSVTSEHSNFPATNTQLRDFNKPWRSNYGAGSGWGNFVITANVNDRLDFREGGGEITVNLTPGTYGADTLCAHLKANMDAAGAHTYTWEYLESGADTNKFKCTDGTGNCAFRWKTDTNGSDNTGRTVGDTIGFDETADDGLAPSHTADFIRIHTRERVWFTRDSTIDVYGCIIKGHNLQAGAEVKLAGSNDNFATTPLNDTLTVQDDILILEYDVAQTYQDWRIHIADVDNADGYVEMGVVFLGAHFQPTKHFAYNRTIAQNDPSLIKESEDGQVTSIQRSHFQAWQYRFNGTNQKTNFDAMFDDRGFSKSLFICEDPDTPLTTTHYVMFRNWSWEHLFDSYWNLSLATREER